MTPTSPQTLSRTREILQDLEAVRENLLALSDDIWAVFWPSVSSVNGVRV